MAKPAGYLRNTTIEKAPLVLAHVKAGGTRAEALKLFRVGSQTIIKIAGRIYSLRLPETVSGFRWTTEIEIAVTALWHDGISVTEIARRIGANRNQVAGKVRRLGLPGRPVPANLRRKRV